MTTPAASREHVDAILAAYRASSSLERELGASWYGDARETAHRLAAEYGATLDTAAGIIAALSPRQTWSGNVRAAETLLAAYALGLELPAVGLRRNAAKAWRIAAGEDPDAVLSGPKVRSFFRNILGDPDAVTVDTWAARVAGETRATFTPAQYGRLAAAYRAAAAALGLAPAIVQATTWIHVRGAAD